MWGMWRRKRDLDEPRWARRVVLPGRMAPKNKCGWWLGVDLNRTDARDRWIVLDVRLYESDGTTLRARREHTAWAGPEVRTECIPLDTAEVEAIQSWEDGLVLEVTAYQH